MKELVYQGTLQTRDELWHIMDAAADMQNRPEGV
jgi:hypothetical protein